MALTFIQQTAENQGAGVTSLAQAWTSNELLLERMSETSSTRNDK
jgi:hypothetical protein